MATGTRRGGLAPATSIGESGRMSNGSRAALTCSLAPCLALVAGVFGCSDGTAPTAEPARVPHVVHELLGVLSRGPAAGGGR